MSTASSPTISGRQQRRRGSAWLLLAALLLTVSGVTVGVHARGDHQHAAARVSAPVAARAAAAAPVDTSGSDALSVAAATLASTGQPGAVAPVGARGGEAEAIAAGQQTSGQQASSNVPTTTIAPPLTVYIVATAADQALVQDEIANDAQAVSGPGITVEDAVAVAISPDDPLTVQELPAMYPNNRVTIVDLRQ